MTISASQIGIVDVGLGNIKSISRMIEKVGAVCSLVSSPSDLNNVRKIILPGVGSFDYGMNSLLNANLVEPINDFAKNGNGLILGICLGMQLLCQESEEGIKPGLALVNAKVQKISINASQLKVPHMGWNVVTPVRSNSLIPETDEELRFYFVHSYCVIPTNPSIVLATSHYGGEFCTAFQDGNIFGVQFHPEKSHRFGMALMKQFVEL